MSLYTLSFLIFIFKVVVVVLRKVINVVFIDDIALCELLFFNLGGVTRDILVVAHHIKLFENTHVVASVGH